MDSFSTGTTGVAIASDTSDLPQIRHAIQKLEETHKGNGATLSGRIIHLCHYLPIVSSLQRTPESDIPSPPKTPDQHAIDISSRTAKEEAKPFSWNLTPRRGHTAMHSGIKSLSSTHKQVVIAYTGEIHLSSSGSSSPAIVGGGAAAPGVDTVSHKNLSEEEKKTLESELATYKDPVTETSADVTYVPVFLDDKVARGHYDGYCKNTLWPLFHYLLWQDVTHEISSHESDFNAYVAANEAFAQKLQEIYQPGDLIWVQDYHLLLLPKLFRQLVPDAFIGLFVHTPFPSSEVFRALPRRKEILDGMLGANLVCFQTYSYSRHFASSCIRVCGYESHPNGIDVAGQVVSIAHCPVGIDAERVERDTLRPGIKPKLEALRALYQGKKIIVGRDKLDVVKGVLQKLKAFEKLLLDYPQWRGNVVLIQVTSPALSDNPKVERQVSEMVAHINGEYGSLDFIPVHHYHQHIKKDEFYALLSVADLALITPLRDGMNTTSMEFVICQNQVINQQDVISHSQSPLSETSTGLPSLDAAVETLSEAAQSVFNTADKALTISTGTVKRAPSPIVMSEFMGISNMMLDGAMLINPWNLEDVAAQINNGLTMSDEEKYARQGPLYKTVTTHTSHTWAAVLVKTLLEKIGAENTAHQTPFLDLQKLTSKYNAAKKRLFMFDYDGTLTPIVKTPSMAVPSPETLTALEKLSEDPRNVVFIISGRDGGFLDQHLGHFNKIGFSAEHGCFMREPGLGRGVWTNLTKSFDMSWMQEVKEIFEYYTERTTGSFIEMKQSSITWHYRATDPEWGSFQCKQCLDLLETNLAPKRPIEVLVGKKNLEVRPIAINKGEIVKRLLYQNPDAEFVFCAGDDKTDEDMFRALCAIKAPSYGAPDTKTKMPPPISATLTITPGSTPPVLEPVELDIKPEGVFATTVGTSTKKTLATWHVTTPSEIVDHMLELVGIPSVAPSPPPGAAEDAKL